MTVSRNNLLFLTLICCFSSVQGQKTCKILQFAKDTIVVPDDWEGTDEELADFESARQFEVTVYTQCVEQCCDLSSKSLW